ncbi:conserved hypothetical protein [Mucor ambiguus]|uniref:SCA7 domain-containing protein n=1 Tax=Mucor ambiguus TaxID=91626 RepID=A0A0C9MKL0_9FUNG|nr:conserved hypothetical protein [Mucor ambiguus]
MSSTIHSKKVYSDEDDDSDDMGTNKPQAKPNKKRKRNAIKRFDDEQHATNTNTVTTAIESRDTPQLEDNDDTEDKVKKKVKREKKVKPKAIPKKKAPLDLDRQCGVLIAPLMNPCTRSLTCKIHAMGAKRAVEGRTQPFNELLAAYQKKGIGRPQVPAGGILSQANQHAHQQKSSSTKASMHKQQQQQQAIDDDQANNASIDSDEETETIRMAIEQNRPYPLGCRQVYYVRRKREYHKLREILLEAITPKVNPSTPPSSTATNTTNTTTTST